MSRVEISSGVVASDLSLEVKWSQRGGFQCFFRVRDRGHVVSLWLNVSTVRS